MSSHFQCKHTAEPAEQLLERCHVLSCSYPLEATFVLSTKREFCILTATLVLSWAKCDNFICLHWGIFKYSAVPLIHPEGKHFLQSVTGCVRGCKSRFVEPPNSPETSSVAVNPDHNVTCLKAEILFHQIVCMTG